MLNYIKKNNNNNLYLNQNVKRRVVNLIDIMKIAIKDRKKDETYERN